MIVTDEKLKEIMSFFHEIGKLRDVKRQGFVVCGIKDAQNSAEHSFRFAIMAMVLGHGRGLDVNKTIKIGLIHDLAEARIGDIITWKSYQMNEKEKLEKEQSALVDMVKPLGEEEKEILELWKEFEYGKTPEAKFAKELDKLEMVFQAFEYEQGKEKMNSGIHKFYDYGDKDSAGAVKSEDLREMTNRIMKLRTKLGYDKKDRYPDPTDALPKDK